MRQWWNCCSKRWALASRSVGTCYSRCFLSLPNRCKHVHLEPQIGSTLDDRGGAEAENMYLFKRSLVLSCGMSASALILAINAGATDFTTTTSPPITTFTLQFGTDDVCIGDVGTVQEGWVKDVMFCYGIRHDKLAIRWMSGKSMGPNPSYLK